jgi:hypothetical protein
MTLLTIARRISARNIPEEFKAIERQFPVMPYVRESRRMVGVHTLTAGEIQREGVPPRASRTFASSIALGDYPADLHGCSEEPTLDFELERTADRPAAGTRGGLFQVPIETLIPESTDGFLAAEKNISQTRLADGATRLQPITMLTGQAAGLLAALAVESGIPPRRVGVGKVQKILLGEKSALSLAQFQDVPRDKPVWPAVQMAIVRGWMAGLHNENFGPGEPVKRRTAAAILAERADLNSCRRRRLRSDEWNLHRGRSSRRARERRCRAGSPSVIPYLRSESAKQDWRSTCCNRRAPRN